MSKNRVELKVLVQPNARTNGIVSFSENILKVRIAAPPVKGRANSELNKFLSSVLGISKSSVTIKRGIASKQKLVVIDGLTQHQITEKLENVRDSKRVQSPPMNNGNHIEAG